jgi:predicted nucleic acid-binding protein
MPEAISNTSPLLYLYRINALDWLPELFSKIWIPNAVVLELREGQHRGYDVPVPSAYAWLQIVEPQSIPPELMTMDLGLGELAALALALETPNRIVLLDDGLARRTAQASALNVWGTLRVLLEAKSQGLTESITPLVDRLRDSGMWLSEDIRNRILNLAGE